MDTRVELDSVMIDRPIEAVFSFLANMENSPIWGRTQETTQISEGTVRVGSRFREVAASDEGGLEKETTITELHPPKSYSYTSRYENGIEERATVTLEEASDGTRVQPTADIYLPGVPREMEEAVVGEMQAEVKRLLANLKAHLEDDSA